MLEAERELAGMCSNWQQFHLLTRRKEVDLEDEQRDPTRNTFRLILLSNLLW